MMRTSLFDTMIVASDPVETEGYWTTFSEAGLPSAAGVQVSADTAMRVSAVYRCVSILANSGAMLSGGVYQRLDRGRRRIQDHELYRLLWKQPNPYQRPFEFKRTMLACAMLRGSAFARVLRRRGRLELWPLHPDRIRGPEILETGNRRYVYTHPKTGQEETMLADETLLVVNGLSIDGVRGLAMSDLARDSIGLAIATEKYGAQLFSKGARFSGGLKLPPGKSMQEPRAREEIRKVFRDQGAGPGNWWGIPIFEDGMEWQTISMSNDDAQFLETRKFTLSDIARWFGVPPHMIGDVERSTSWGTGIEQQSIQFVAYALMPWLKLFEESFSILIGNGDDYLRFNVESLLRADAKTRHEIYEIGNRIGMYSPNDCLELEDKNPRTGGDVYVTPTAPQQAAGSVPPPDDSDDDSEVDDQAMVQIQGLTSQLAERIAALEARPVPQLPGESRAAALESFRSGAAGLGVPPDAVRRLIANAKPKKEDQHA